MNDTFADRMRAEGLAGAADLPDGARLAVELHSRLTREGWVWDDVSADDDG